MNTTSAVAAVASYVIPLNLLALSPLNVRKTGGTNVDDLAASIQSIGLVQNLTVVQTGKGKKPRYEVIAGGRRLRALKQLSKAEIIPTNYGVRCEVRTAEEAAEISTAENVVREAMHPADQLDAFKLMIDEGKSIDDVSVRFGVSTLVVRQRLKLACLAPCLMDAYRTGHASLEQLMALAISEDHDEQERVWNEAVKHGGWMKQPERLRAALTIKELTAKDRMACFVTVAAYEKAGGAVRRDLFGDDVYICDVPLLMTLVADKLERKAVKIRAEGWGWVEVRESFGYDDEGKFRKLDATRRAATTAELDELDSISAEVQPLYELECDEGSEEDTATTASITALEARARLIHEGMRLNPEDPEIRALAGAVVSIDHSGKAVTRRGLLRSDAYKTLTQPKGDADGAAGTPAAGKAGDDAKGGLSEALIRRLTAHRTVAVRSMLASNPRVALIATVHALAVKVFYSASSETVLSLAGPDNSRLRIVCPDIETATGAVAFDATHKAVKDQLPDDVDSLWAWLEARDTDALLAVLAVCVAPSVDLVMGYSVTSNNSGNPLASGGALVKALGLDMADFWAPTASSYLASVSKPLIGEAVTEALGEEAAKPLAAMKKRDAAEAAETLLHGSRWVPALFR